MEWCRRSAMRPAASAAGADEVDLDGGFLMPSFGDGHAHPLYGGLESAGPAVRPCKSVDEIVSRRRRIRRPNTRTTSGSSARPTTSSLAPDGLFDARWLDAAVPDRPVVLRAWDYHTMWCNSVALQRAGITADTPDPVLGEIPHREDGSVLGTLREWGAVDLVNAVMPARDEDVRIGGAGHGRRLLPGPRRDVGAGRLGRTRRRRHLRRGGPPRCAADAVQPRASTPIRATSIRRWRFRRRAAPRRRGRLAAADRPDGEVLRRRRGGERDRCAARAVLLRAAQPRHAQLGGRLAGRGGAPGRRAGAADPHPRDRRRGGAPGAGCDRTCGAAQRCRATGGR